MTKEFLFLGFPLCSREVRKIAYYFAQANGFEGLVKIPVRQVKSGSLSCWNITLN